MGLKWTDEHVDVLLAEQDDEIVSDLTGHSLAAVWRQRQRLAGSPQPPLYVTNAGRAAIIAACPSSAEANTGPWTDEEIALLSDTDYALWEVAQACNRTYCATQKKAASLGIRRRHSKRRPRQGTGVAA